MANKLELAVDFDGVVHDKAHPVAGRRMGPPIEGAQAALKLLKAKGHKVIIFSCWGDETGRRAIANWMRFYDIPFDSVTNVKPNVDFFIDDKAIHFTSWQQVLPMVL